jgi:hypothetical protein
MIEILVKKYSIKPLFIIMDDDPNDEQCGDKISMELKDHLESTKMRM